MHPGRPIPRRARAAALAALVAFASSGPGRACSPEGALPTELTDIRTDGTLVIADGLRLRLAGILWPDISESGLRRGLADRLRSALADARLSWRPAAGPDRWGIVPAFLFAREREGDTAPFLVQAGLAEQGAAPYWPDPGDATCLAAIRTHEALALKARRGAWAPRVQTQRLRALADPSEDPAGRRIAAVFRVHGVRAGRSLLFVNLSPRLNRGTYLGLTARQVSELTRRGWNPLDWKGKRLLVRGVVDPFNTRRFRVSSVEHLSVVE